MPHHTGITPLTLHAINAVCHADILFPPGAAASVPAAAICRFAGFRVLFMAFIT